MAATRVTGWDGLASGKTGIADPGTVDRDLVQELSGDPLLAGVPWRRCPTVSRLLKPWSGSSSCDGSVSPKADGLVRV